MYGVQLALTSMTENTQQLHTVHLLSHQRNLANFLCLGKQQYHVHVQNVCEQGRLTRIC